MFGFSLPINTCAYAFVLVMESRIVVSLCRTKICILESFAIHVHIGHLDAVAKYERTNYGRPVRGIFFNMSQMYFQSYIRSVYN